MLTDRVVAEVLGDAKGAGRVDDAVVLCQDLLARFPDSGAWLTATARALLEADRPAEADALLKRRLSAAADPAVVEALGPTAGTLGRDGVAVDAARRLHAFGGDRVVTVLLLEAEVASHNGDKRSAAGLLDEAAEEARRRPDPVERVADALEADGRPDRAVTLLRQANDAHPSDAVAGRLASLLLSRNRPGDAAVVLTTLGRSAATAAGRAQAARQSVAAAAAGTLDRIIVDAQDLGLLVDALLKTDDPAAAVAAIHVSPLSDTPERLRRLSVMYQRRQDYPHAAGVLRDLLAADPSHAAGTREQLAMVQLAMNDAAGAADTVAQLRQSVGDGPAAFGLMAGVYDRLRRPADAARAYRRVLAARPGHADDWLLWSAARAKSGRGDQARRRLQMLCVEADTDGPFAAAVDGLLNLDAGPNALRAARQQAVLRPAARPRSMTLVHVVADLSDEPGHRRPTPGDRGRRGRERRRADAEPENLNGHRDAEKPHHGRDRARPVAAGHRRGLPTGLVPATGRAATRRRTAGVGGAGDRTRHRPRPNERPRRRVVEKVRRRGGGIAHARAVGRPPTTRRRSCRAIRPKRASRCRT